MGLKQVKYLELFSALLIAPLRSWRETSELRFRWLPTAVLRSFAAMTSAWSGIGTQGKARAFPGLLAKKLLAVAMATAAKKIIHNLVMFELF